ncbi:MAG: ChaN family lipoprotein [Gemmatimonadales bacterium]
MGVLLLLLAQRPDTGALERWAPHRVYDTHHKRFSDFESLASNAARADVVFLGEEHDDRATHEMELALLQAIARRRGNVVVSLEMFERDVQPILDKYLAGAITEEDFLRSARPWPNYATDYRPLVEFARAHGWRVIAGNIPRRMASAVATSGLATVAQWSDSTRGWAAAEFQCPEDDYFRRFGKAMGDHPMGPGPLMSAEELRALMVRFYQAQCVKDETMAESIARAHGDGRAPLVIQYNGDFHSDFGEGTVARVKRRLPGSTLMVISAIPVTSLDSIKPKPLRKQADWLLFVLKS